MSDEMKEYIVHGVEEVYDAFDEFEHYNDLKPETVQAASIQDAMRIGEKKLRQQVEEARKDFRSSGSFFPYLTQMFLDGKLVYKKEPPEHAQW